MQKNKILLIVFVLLLASSALVLYRGFSSQPLTEVLAPPTVSSNDVVALSQAEAVKSKITKAINKIDTGGPLDALIDNAQFQDLITTTTAPTIIGSYGRANPFLPPTSTVAYTNTVYTYSIGYPNSFTLADNNSTYFDLFNKTGSLSPGDITLGKKISSTDMLSISILKDPRSSTYATFDEYMAAVKTDQENAKKKGTPYTMKDITIGKGGAIKATEFYSQGQTKVYLTFFNRNNNYLYATVSIFPGQDQKSIEKTYRDILNSLMFNN